MVHGEGNLMVAFTKLFRLFDCVTSNCQKRRYRYLGSSEAEVTNPCHQKENGICLVGPPFYNLKDYFLGS